MLFQYSHIYKTLSTKGYVINSVKSVIVLSSNMIQLKRIVLTGHNFIWIRISRFSVWWRNLKMEIQTETHKSWTLFIQVHLFKEFHEAVLSNILTLTHPFLSCCEGM